jgi:hypothetical protein
LYRSKYFEYTGDGIGVFEKWLLQYASVLFVDLRSGAKALTAPAVAHAWALAAAGAVDQGRRPSLSTAAL